MKLGRNEPCWCGSGKKYKNCHLRREQESPPSIEEVIQARRGPFERKYCLHPEAGPSECGGKIVRAHTVQKSGGLQRIARNGHVYALRAGSISSATLEPTLIGVKKASTFTGFCSKHDNKTFEPIEKTSFLPCAQHAFLLGYRALCRELFGKRAMIEAVQNLKTMDRGRSLGAQVSFHRVLRKIETGAKLGLRDIEHYKSIYDNILISMDYSLVRYYIVEFGATPEVLGSAAQFPSFDFEGNRLQSLRSQQVLDKVEFSVVATVTGGAAVFTWMGDSEPVGRMIRSLDAHSDQDITSAFVRYAFEFFENVYFSPDWWENLDAGARAKLQARTTGAATLSEVRRSDCLVDDGLRPVSWPVVARHMQF